MTSIEADRERDKIARREFIARGAGWSAALALLAFPGIAAGLSAAPGDKAQEETWKELQAKAEKFMPMLGTCSQTSFAALNEQFGLKADHTIPALMPFAGGIAGRGETCGAVSGSLLALGFFFGAANPRGKKQVVSPFQYAGTFFTRFEKEFGSTRCREVVKHQFGRYYDFLDPQEQKLFMAASKQSGKCLEVVKKAVCIAGDIILENS